MRLLPLDHFINILYAMLAFNPTLPFDLDHIDREATIAYKDQFEDYA